MSGPRVLHLQYANPAAYPPLEHAARILAARGARVRFLGVHVGEVRALRFAEREGVEVRLLPECPPGPRQKLHYLWFVAWALWHVLRWRPDAVYVSDVTAAPAGLLLQRVAGVPVVYHEHDAPPSSLGRRRWGRACLGARARLARAAAAVVVPNAERGRLLARESGGAPAVHVAWNCPERAEAARPREAAEGPLRLVFHGSIVPERLPLAVLDAMARLDGPAELTVAGYEPPGGGGYCGALRARAAELGIGERVRFAGIVRHRADLLRLCARHDAGFALMPAASDDVNLRWMAGASNKPFDYLACGVCPIVSDLPEWRRAFVEPGYALACDPADADGVAAALRWAAAHRAELRAMAEAGRRRVLEDWNYEHQFRPVADVLCAAPRRRRAEAGA
ncbi:MAG TPA: glycosyltransferase [Longimicrobiaceae bacterium]